MKRKHKMIAVSPRFATELKTKAYSKGKTIMDYTEEIACDEWEELFKKKRRGGKNSIF